MEPSIHAIKLIVVDDNDSNLLVLKEILERPGVEIITSNDPENVSEICIKEEISIALIDVKMPKMSGFDLLIQLKSNPVTENIVVILMTGYSMSSDEVYFGLSSGAVDYLFKPLDMHITVAKVNSLLTMIQYQREIQRKNKELEYFQKDLYVALEEAEKGKMIKENFLANMSHEIRTPLNAIVGITNLLKTSHLDAGQRKMIRLMDFSSEALLGIVNDVLENFQMDAGKIKIDLINTDINTLFETVGETLKPLAAEKGLTLNYKILGKTPSSIKADPLRLKQILINLINNAIKFTPSGTIEISLRALTIGTHDAELQFMVRDSGLGIPESSLPQIFKRFEQVQDKTWQKFGGTGLGLSIVKRLVELMQGKMEVSSVVGVGTTFLFTSSFELSDPEFVRQQVSNKIASVELADFINVSVLLVEDNVINQFVAVRMLQGWNVKVDTALNGQEAFDKLSVKNYDLVLMDTHMPVMNGIDATRKIRNELNGAKSNIPIISFSASVIENEKLEALNAGVDDFLEKPFQPESLHKKIKRFMRKPK